jgi:hypothetical protein
MRFIIRNHGRVRFPRANRHSQNKLLDIRVEFYNTVLTDWTEKIYPYFYVFGRSRAYI